jgi:hypothetical protein
MSINREIRISRGGERKINIIASGDLLDPSKHGSEKVGTIHISHQADGRVTVSAADVPFELKLQRSSSPLALDKDRKNRLSRFDRDGKKWVLALGKTGRCINIEPGTELKVTHTTGAMVEDRQAA